MIELRGITLRLRRPPGARATSTCAIDEGELVVVSGRTGVGKSTLLGVLTGLVPRFTGGTLAGDVLLDGARCVHRPPRERAHLVGYVGQDPAAGFVTDTVEEELAYGMEQLGLAPGDDAPPRRGDPRPARHRRPARPRPAHALGRRAAAGRDRLGADHAPAGAGARRADLGARPDRGRGGAGHPDPARARPRRLGADGRAPARAGGAVRRPDGAARPATARSGPATRPRCWPSRPSYRPIVELGRAPGWSPAAA